MKLAPISLVGARASPFDKPSRRRRCQKVWRLHLVFKGAHIRSLSGLDAGLALNQFNSTKKTEIVLVLIRKSCHLREPDEILGPRGGRCL